jgi:predicted DNA repair protein MutK
MAGSSLLALLDDIASVLDDVAALSRIAAKKGAGVLGDDLAVNAQQVAGVQAARELPVVWAVAKGSLINKVVLVPAALLVSALAPWSIPPLMVLGGLFLCYEGFEKVFERVSRGVAGGITRRSAIAEAAADARVDLLALERSKVQGAIRTDFILSAEIIVITLGVVGNEAFVTRLGVLVVIALLMTICVYGLVAGIVKLDDLGVRLARRAGSQLAARAIRVAGYSLLGAAPRLMKVLGFAGTVAMFLVGGGILTHALHVAPAGIVAGFVTDLVVGLVCGAAALACVRLGQRLRRRH